MAVKMDRLMLGRVTIRALHFAPPGPDELKEIRKHYGNNAYRALDKR